MSRPILLRHITAASSSHRHSAAFRSHLHRKFTIVNNNNININNSVNGSIDPHQQLQLDLINSIKQQKQQDGTASRTKVHAELRRFAMTGAVRPGTYEHPDFVDQMGYYFAQGGRHFALYNDFLATCKNGIAARPYLNEQLKVYAVVSHKDMLAQYNTADEIAQRLTDYITTSLAVEYVNVLIIEHLPPTAQIDEPVFQQLLQALEILCTQEKRIIGGYGLDSSRFSGSTSPHSAHLDLRSLLQRHSIRNLQCIRAPFNLVDSNLALNSKEQIQVARTHGIDIHGTSLLMSRNPILSEPHAFYTFPSHSETLAKHKSTWPEYLSSAFDASIALERMYEQIVRDQNLVEAPPMSSIAWGHVVAHNQAILYNTPRWEDALYNDILVQIDTNTDVTIKLEPLKEWTKRYRWVVKTLLHRFSHAVQHTTHHHNVQVSSWLDNQIPRLAMLPKLESKVYAVLNAVQDVDLLCTDDASFTHDIAKFGVEVSNAEALGVLQRAQSELPALLPKALQPTDFTATKRMHRADDSSVQQLTVEQYTEQLLAQQQKSKA